MVVNGNAASSDSLEIAIRWDRVFNGQTDNGDYNNTTGALPASIDGQIGILALHTSNDENPWASRMWLPSLLETGDIVPTGDPGNTDIISTISTPRYLSGVRLIDVDLTDDSVLDIGNATDVGRLSLDADPPLDIVVNGATAFYSSDLVQVTYNKDPFLGTGAEADSALNPANYVLSVGSVTAAAAGTGSRSSQIFLTLDAALAGATDLTINNVSNTAQTATIPAANLSVGPLNIVDVTVDSSGDQQAYLADPSIRGSWDGWSDGGWPLTDGTDAYPEVPGAQIEAGDVAADGVYRGRVFTTAALAGNKFAMRSMYDFGGGVIRGLGPGYWSSSANKGFDVASESTTISIVDDIDNRLTANQIDVTLNATVEGFFASDADAAISTVYVQSGPTYGGENAIPDLNGDLPGEQDVIGAFVLPYVGSAAGVHSYSGQVTYAAQMPDVSEYRLGITIPPAGTGAGDYREADTDFTPSDFTPAPTGVDAKTIHGHIYRIQSDTGARALGRSLDITWQKASFDIPAPPTGASTGVNSWEMYN